MMRRFLLLFLLTLLLAAAASAQEEMPKTIAVLRYGGPAGDPIFVEKRIIAMLESYGYISGEEAAILNERRDLDGERVNLYWGDAGWDIPAANLMVERALDQEADVIVTVTTPVSRAAINLTLDMDDPPVVIASSVLYPYPAGIAQASCLKPDHLIGVVLDVPMELLFRLLLTQQPDIERIGILAGATEISGSEGASALAALAQAHALSADAATIISQSDAILAAEGLMSKDIEALITSWDVLISHNMRSIMDIAQGEGLPVYIPSLPAVVSGAAVSAGNLRDDEEATGVARLLALYLGGDLDPATTGLLELREAGTAVNQDALAALGMTAAPELLAEADLVITDGEHNLSQRYLDALVDGAVGLGVEENSEIDAALNASLQCTDEIIAEQQAALDAAGE